ncbi:methylthioribulose 1-phosphate dehydratase [Limobrevibacterium gyesilva]|uniref:Methylthioribulose-1-phosphate dehydratase n=1 Tax=Limobrevibacterium gyesilva TaxID=2991712 RepID=A0AA41YIY4_9PROT|nr:methylthioribulose 1-phosphate dehydratase [Limobrevibacterium gyesilva]MCW3473370.1 methylthioribulose 1-phosphate dehydratase [Limobrevibacterium gyesilva]
MQPTPAWAIEAIVQAGRRMDARGWVPATAGNISVRLDERRIAITRSGGHKGFLDADGVMQVDLQGRPLTAGKPSAETLLHCQLYRLFPGVGAALHGHSVAATVLSMAGDRPIRLAGYEVLKAFEGQATHDVALELPVFANDQDIARLAAAVEPVVAAGSPLGYLIRGHGVYVWGPDMPAALARLEGLEFLLACELERRRLER